MGTGIQQVLEREGGLATASALRAAGFSAYRIRQSVDSGVLMQMIRGVYVLAVTVSDAERDPAGKHALLVRAYLAVSPGHVASHHSAARLHGIDLLAGPGIPETPRVTLTRTSDHPSFSGRVDARVHRAALPPDHVTRVFNTPVTSAARTVADLARTCPFLESVVAADSAVRRGRTSKEQVRRVLAACPRWPGVAAAQKAIDFASGLAESPLESAARVFFHQAGLPPPRLQGQVWGTADVLFEYRADFLWDEQSTIVEVDGAFKYEDPAKARRQLTRDRHLREAGYEVVHVTWDELFFQLDRVIARIQRVLQTRGPSGASHTGGKDGR